MRRLAWLLERGLLVVGSVLALAAVLAASVGGGIWRLGPLSIRLQRPFRSLAVAAALLLVREALGHGSRTRERLRFMVLFAMLLAAAGLDSRPRIVGDGSEYVAMAWNLAQGRSPALSAEDRAAVETALSLPAGELSAGRSSLLATDTRQDFVHFWLYSLVVAPFLAVVRTIGAQPLLAFTLANALLLLLAAAVVLWRAGPAPTLVFFGGPLLWWLDKPHPEVFLVTVLAVALAIARNRPELALPLVGLVAVQNPVFATVLAVGTTWALALKRGRPFLVPAIALSWALVVVNPLYYLARLARPVPLRDTVLLHVPNLAELRAVLVDPNLGLLPGWPALGLALLLLILVTATRGERWPWWDLAALATAIAALLVVFTLTSNVNHGCTRGMSRYALWLAPFAVPALVRLGAAGGRTRAAVAVLGGLSLVGTIPEYLPRSVERYLEPTRLADWLWTHHPRLDSPLPEVFVERAWGSPPLGSVPAATPRCEKALVRGDGTEIGLWPLSCAPAAKPEWCREEGVLCYAAPQRDGYRFDRAPEQPAFFDRHMLRWCWSGTPEPQLVHVLGQLPWEHYSLVAQRDEGFFIDRRHGIGGLELRTAPGSFLIWIGIVRKGDAWLAPAVSLPSTAILIDPRTGAELSRTALSGTESVRIAIPYQVPLLLVVGEGL